MLAVLLSVKQSWWEKMLTGEKTLEIRKTAPKSGKGRAVTWPLPVLVYVSGTGAVQGRFMCQGWVKTNYLPCLTRGSCVPLHALEEYAAGGQLYGWIVTGAKKYNTPSPLAEFGLEVPPMSWRYIEIPDTAEV